MEGPYVLAAFFCEEVRTDEQSRLWIREVYNLSFATPLGQGAPGIQAQVNFFARLVGGGIDGIHEVRLRCKSALVDIAFDAPFHAEGEDTPADISCPVLIRVLDDGTHWFELLFDDRVLTRVPLRVLRMDRAPLGL